MRKKLLIIMLLLSAFTFLVSCQDTFEYSRHTVKVLPRTYFKVQCKVEDKLYKIGDTIHISVSSGAINYYEIQDGNLVYIANQLPPTDYNYEHLLNDPYDNFAIQVISSKTNTIIESLKLPHFRKENTLHWANGYFVGAYEKFDKHNVIKFKITKDYLFENSGVGFSVWLVSYNDESELDEPISNEESTILKSVASTTIWLSLKNKYLHLYN